MQLELTEGDEALLREILDGVYRDLKYEIADTDTYTYRDELRARRDAIRRLLNGVGGPLDDAPPASAAD